MLIVQKLPVTTNSFVFTRPRPPVVKIVGSKTRASTRHDYDDSDEGQNELIAMERGWLNTFESVLSGRPMPKQKKFLMFQQQCKLSKLPTPLPFSTFEATDWTYVSTFDRKDLQPTEEFLTVTQLVSVPRRHGKFPYCHPGPVVDTISKTRDWFYADSIVQEVKLMQQKKPSYVVRWIGYEDEYNTVECAKNLSDSAILTLYQRRDYATAARSNGAVLLRRSIRGMVPSTLVGITRPIAPQNEHCARAMKLLDDHLLVEVAADRYSKYIGFQA